MQGLVSRKDEPKLSNQSVVISVESQNFYVVQHFTLATEKF